MSALRRLPRLQKSRGCARGVGAHLLGPGGTKPSSSGAFFAALIFLARTAPVLRRLILIQRAELPSSRTAATSDACPTPIKLVSH